MAPTPPQAVDNGRSSGDQPRDVRDVEDEEEYERDGWRMGFDVAFHGVGRTAENGDEESEEEFATGFGTPPIAAAEDSSSEFESDPESDVETEPRNPTEGAPDGYVALRTIIEDPGDRPEVSEDDEEEKEAETKPENVPNLHFSHSFVSPGISKDFQQALEDANSVYSNHSCLELATVPSSSGQPINMDKHKITEIRKIMANVSIPEPYWAKDLGDTKVLELLEKLKRKEKD